MIRLIQMKARAASAAMARLNHLHHLHHPVKMDNSRKIRLWSALILIAAEAVSLVVLDVIPSGEAYYYVCSLFNALIVAVFGFLPYSPLTIRLLVINMLACAVQGFGLLSYLEEWPIIIYNISIHTLTALQIWHILRTDGNHGNGTIYSRVSLVFRPTNFLFANLHKKEKVW